MKPIRIHKFLAQQGIASRRAAERLITSGVVTVNNHPAHLGQIIGANDVVRVNHQVVANCELLYKYYLLNKPKQTICSRRDNFKRPTVVDLIADPDYLFPVGRLDYDTTGVLLITNDGELAHRLLHPSFAIPRVYRARLNRILSSKELLFLNSARVQVDNKPSLQEVEHIANKAYLVRINQGSYHHIKKLFAQVGAQVWDLKRTEFAFLSCAKMMVGQWRPLKANEIKKLRMLVNL